MALPVIATQSVRLYLTTSIVLSHTADGYVLAAGYGGTDPAHSAPEVDMYDAGGGLHIGTSSMPSHKGAILAVGSTDAESLSPSTDFLVTVGDGTTISTDYMAYQSGLLHKETDYRTSLGGGVSGRVAVPAAMADGGYAILYTTGAVSGQGSAGMYGIQFVGPDGQLNGAISPAHTVYGAAPWFPNETLNVTEFGLAALQNGNLVVAQEVTGSSASEYEVILYSPTHAVLSDTFYYSPAGLSESISSAGGHSVAALSTDKFVVANVAAVPGTWGFASYTVFRNDGTRLFDGSIAPNANDPNTRNPLPAVASLPDGQVAFVWTDTTSAVATPTIKLEILDVNGVSENDPFVVSTIDGALDTHVDPTYGASVTAIDATHVAVSWTDLNGGFYAGRMNIYTLAIPYSVVVNTTTDYRATTPTNIQAIQFNASANVAALFSAAQFGGAGVSTSAKIYGDAQADQIGIDASAATSFSAAGFTFYSWTDDVDSLVIYGGSASSTLTGSSRDDAILAGPGNDTIDAGAGDNYISAGAGNDVLLAGSGNDIGYGGAGNDYINLGNGADIVLAGDGNDTIFGGLGHQILFGEAGDDVIFTGDGNNFAAGGSGNDVIYGGAGDEYMLGGDGTNFFVAGGSGHNTLVGGTGLNDLRGAAGTDSFFSSGSKDYLTGGGGTDYFYVFAKGAVANNQTFIMDWNAGGAQDYLVLPSGLKGSTQVFDQGGYTWIATGAPGGYDYLAIVGQPGAANVTNQIVWS